LASQLLYASLVTAAAINYNNFTQLRLQLLQSLDLGSQAMALASQLLQASLVSAAAINNDDLVWLRLQLLQLLQCRHDATSLIQHLQQQQQPSCSAQPCGLRSCHSLLCAVPLRM
jgi:hypothetical protein